tara:strand:- start:591 stop:866 length:276 start_codon:yes stop_codon:yes gene_type:complete
MIDGLIMLLIFVTIALSTLGACVWMEYAPLTLKDIKGMTKKQILKLFAVSLMYGPVASGLTIFILIILLIGPYVTSQINKIQTKSINWINK